MNVNSSGPRINMTTASRPTPGVMRFEVRDKPIQLTICTCGSEVFRLAEVLCTDGNLVKTKLLKAADGSVVQMGAAHLDRYTLQVPGEYALMFVGPGTPKSTITRREMGIQFMEAA